MCYDISKKEGIATTTEEKVPFDIRGAKSVFSKIALSLIAFIAVSYTVVFALELLCLWLLPETMYTASLSVAVSSIGMYVCGVPIFALLVRKLPKTTPEAAHARVSTTCVLFLIGMAFMYAGSIVGNFAYNFVSEYVGLPMQETTLELVEQLPWYVALVFTVIMAPIFEELVFRKLIIDRVNVYGEKLAIAFSALMFAFFHMSIQQFFYAFLLGLLLGYLYIRTGKLIYPVIIHAAINFCGSVIPLLLMRYAGYNELLSATTPDEMLEIAAANPVGYAFIMLYSFSLIAIVIAGCAMFGVYRRKLHFKTAPLQLPRDTEATVALTPVGVILYIAVCVALPVVLTLI